jgi:N4-gp56 family major capsid protein
MPTLVANIPASVREFYTKEIIRESQPRLRFAQFAKKRTDLNSNAGSSIEFTKYSSITKGGKLTEGVSIDEKAMNNSRVSIPVDEYGNAVTISEKALQLSMHNELQEASIALANDMSQVLDTELMNVALSTTNTIYGNGKANAGALVEGDGFTARTVKDVVEKLGTNNAPKFEGAYYVCIAHPHQLRQLRDDPNWVDAHKYVETGVGNLYMGEVGMYEGVRFVETTNVPANDAVESQLKFGINIPTWEAVIFGENSYAWAEALPVEMRESEIKDYGRMHGIAWYAIWGFGLIEEKNIFSVLTA